MIRKPTDYLVTPDLDKPDEWTYQIDHKAIADMSKRVGRESDATTQRLTDVIGGRTVVLLLNGGSIGQLEGYIGGFAHFDFCYMGINRFVAIEQNILNKAGVDFDIVFCMSEQDIPRRVHDLVKFLSRGVPNLLMTTLCAMTWLDKTGRNSLLDKYSDKLYLLPRLLCRPAYPISLEVIIEQLIKAKVERLILFGADGYLEPVKEDAPELDIIRWNQQKMLSTYYDQEFFKTERRATGVGVGTVRFNRNFKYEPEKMRIVNCSMESRYEHIPKVSYTRLMGMLAVGEWQHG